MLCGRHSIRSIYSVWTMAVCVCLVFLTLPPESRTLDLDRWFPQRVDTEFFRSLLQRPYQPRAVFLANPADPEYPLVFHATFMERERIFRFRMVLDISTERFLSPAVMSMRHIPYTARKNDGTSFYTRGTALKNTLGYGANRRVAVLYVPWFIDNISNTAFVCDLGFLQADAYGLDNFVGLNGGTTFQSLVETLFKPGTIQVSRRVRFNRYYYNRPDYFGRVGRLLGTENDIFKPAAWLPALHKISLHKKHFNHAEKEELDRHLCLLLLGPEYPLLSQNERVKQGMIPPSLNLDQNRLEGSDMAAGQNINVFLSVGPGINYFDDPWLAPRRNIPSPRFIFHRTIYYLRRFQLYPSYSIEPLHAGHFRFDTLNSFQLAAGVPAPECDGDRRSVYMPLERRQTVLDNLCRAIIRYGLLNDSPELTPGFSFMGDTYRGSVINNEVKLFDASYPAFETIALIVPPGTKQRYLEGYEELLAVGRALPFLSGTHYRDYFVESPTADDLGFRMAYLEVVLRSRHRLLTRLFRRARLADGRASSGYHFLARATERMIARQGIESLKSVASSNLSYLESRVQKAWLDYLEAVRTGLGQQQVERCYRTVLDLYRCLPQAELLDTP